MEGAKVMMLSIWMGDEGRRLEERAAHLLAKTYRPLRWVWVVDSYIPDRTLPILWQIADSHPDKDITIVPIETYGEMDRLQRISIALSLGLDQVREDDDLVMIHESDIESPPDVIEQLLAPGLLPIGAWPVLELHPGQDVFYDIWAYRKDGKNFHNYPPYCDGYDPDAPFPVDGVGTVWIIHAEDVRDGVRCHTECAKELCDKLRERGRQFWAHPNVIVRQPRDLWVPYQFEPRW